MGALWRPFGCQNRIKCGRRRDTSRIYTFNVAKIKARPNPNKQVKIINNGIANISTGKPRLARRCNGIYVIIDRMKKLAAVIVEAIGIITLGIADNDRTPPPPLLIDPTAEVIMELKNSQT